MARDTKERILVAALALFNDEGEDTLSAVDIATALDISPGHLYYHFKGKDAIITALFDRFEEEMDMILDDTRVRAQSLDEVWVYCLIILEEVYDLRFFFRNLDGMAVRLPGLMKRFHRFRRRLETTLAEMIEALQKIGIVKLDARLKPLLIERMAASVLYWPLQDKLAEAPLPAKAAMRRTTFGLLAQLVPFMGKEGSRFLDALERHSHLDA
jgi:AcrR family transcriptional regulator